MMLASVSTEEIKLFDGREVIITWHKTIIDAHRHHTKREYLKIMTDGDFKVAYEIKWKHEEGTSQPLQITIYRVTKDFQMIMLHQHVTVCVGNPITVKKDFSFQFKTGDRVCIGAKNFSSVDFTLINSKLSLTQL
jgi:hypothetical protein